MTSLKGQGRCFHNFFWRFVLIFFLFIKCAGSVDIVNMDQLIATLDASGNSKMSNGETANLLPRTYQCTTSTDEDETEVSCSQSWLMLLIQSLSGTIQCTSDIEAPCVIDGQEQTQLVNFQQKDLVVRALTFANGRYGRGGGVSIDTGTNIDFLICVFTNNGGEIISQG